MAWMISSSLRCIANASRFWVFWMRNTIRKVAIVVPVLTMVSNQLSRDVERRADAFSLRLTHDPQTLIDFQRRIAIKNVSDPDPPAISRFLLGTHPTTLERIGQAEAYRR